MKAIKITGLVPKVSTRPSTRSKTKNTIALDNLPLIKGKRKADASPVKNGEAKRCALVDLSNAANKINPNSNNKVVKIVSGVNVRPPVRATVRTVLKQRAPENIPPRAPKAKPATRGSLKNAACVEPNETVQKPKKACTEKEITAKVKTRLSNEFQKNDTLYSTALDETITPSNLSTSKPEVSVPTPKSGVSFISHQLEKQLNLGNHDIPDGIVDFDKENWDDVFQISHYAMDIFNYLKTRESEFRVSDYITRQHDLTKTMRSLLVDWMVDVQESFELNHETLYLGVKLVDLYLSRSFVTKETLQLVGAAAMFIASKYDERIPPLVDDFLYICDGAYKRGELLRMEIDLLKVCNFDLGLPLSYRFLRRYARCAKVTMPILTLARYILEFSLMDYNVITMSDSKQAAATLFMALRMKNVSGWTPTLEFYTGYKLDDFVQIVLVLNNGLHKKCKDQLMTVRNKYSHKIFYEVAKTPLLADLDLLVNVDRNKLFGISTNGQLAN